MSKRIVTQHRRALVINASPKNGKTLKFCKTFERAFGSQHTKRLNLAKNPPPHSDGTFKNTGTRWQEDTLKSDVLFIATPVYWFNVPSTLKAYLDDLAAIERKLWKNERFVIVAVHAPEGGEIGALNAIILPLNSMGFTLPRNGFVYYRGPSDDWAWKDIEYAAEEVSEVGDPYAAARTREKRANQRQS